MNHNLIEIVTVSLYLQFGATTLSLHSNKALSLFLTNYPHFASLATTSPCIAYTPCTIYFHMSIFTPLTPLPLLYTTPNTQSTGSFLQPLYLPHSPHQQRRISHQHFHRLDPSTPSEIHTLPPSLLRDPFQTLKTPAPKSPQPTAFPNINTDTLQSQSKRTLSLQSDSGTPSSHTCVVSTHTNRSSVPTRTLQQPPARTVTSDPLDRTTATTTDTLHCQNRALLPPKHYLCPPTPAP